MFSWTLYRSIVCSDSIYDILQILIEGIAKQTYAKICFSPNMSSVTSVNMLQLTYVWGKAVDKINIYIYTFCLRLSCFELVLRLLGAVKVVQRGAQLHTYVMTTYDKSSDYRRVCLLTVVRYTATQADGIHRDCSGFSMEEGKISNYIPENLLTCPAFSMWPRPKHQTVFWIVGHTVRDTRRQALNRLDCVEFMKWSKWKLYKWLM
jgi:hypothetical protein